MIDVVKLAEFVETKLNLNSEGLEFRTYTFEQHLDKRYEKVSGVNESFIPSIITTPTGSYLPTNDKRGSRLSFNLEIMMPLTYKEQWLDMLNAFVWELNGKVFYITSTGTYTETRPTTGSYTTSKFGVQVPTFGTLTPQNFTELNQISSYLPISKTQFYIAITVPISLKTIDGFIVGDEALVYLAKYVNETSATHTYTKLKISDFSVKHAKVPLTNHFIGETSGSTVIQESDSKYIMTAYYESNDLLDEIVGNALAGTGQNQWYWLKVVRPIKSNPYSATTYRRVVLVDDSAVFPIDDYAIIPLVFANTKSMG